MNINFNSDIIMKKLEVQKNDSKKDSEIGFKDLIRKSKDTESTLKNTEDDDIKQVEEIKHEDSNENDTEIKNLMQHCSQYILCENNILNIKYIDIEEIKNNMAKADCINANSEPENKTDACNLLGDVVKETTDVKSEAKTDIKDIYSEKAFIVNDKKSNENIKSGAIYENDIVSPKKSEHNQVLSKNENIKDSLNNTKVLDTELNLDQVTVEKDDKIADIIKPNLLKYNEELIVIKVADSVDKKAWIPAIRELGNMVSNNIKENITENFKVSLNPKDLGKIDVDFTIKDNKVFVSFICSNENTSKIIAENASMLSKLIESNLGQETTINVYSEEQLGHQNNKENFDGRGNNSYYRDDSNNRKKQNDQEDSDFIQKLRLGILEFDDVEV